jgi:hypothetical protein
MYLRGFDLEKLLGSAEGQIIQYEMERGGSLQARRRPLSDNEGRCAGLKREVREGAMRFVRDAAKVRDRIFPGYKPCRSTAGRIYEAFMTGQSPKERALLRSMALDDHYCGRGIVE